MIYRSVTAAIWFGLGSGMVLAPGAAGQATTPAPAGEQQAVLLDNGEVLYGTIVEMPQGVELHAAERGRVRIPRDQIATVKRSLSELYHWQREQLSRNDSRSALQLAEWCLQHGLTQQAAEVLWQAAQLPHDEQRLQELRQRLQQEILRQRRGTEVPVARPGRPRSPAEPPAPIRLPTATMVEYTSRIQPLLLNRCGNATCHGRGTNSEFELSRPPAGSPLTRGLTQTNLARIARYIHDGSPDQSRLMEMAREVHGGANQVPLTDDQRQRLGEWVRQVAGRSPGEASAELATIPVPPAQATIADRSVNPAGGDDIRPAPPPGTASRIPPTRSTPPESADPYDPAPYNEQYVRPRQAGGPAKDGPE